MATLAGSCLIMRVVHFSEPIVLQKVDIRELTIRVHNLLSLHKHGRTELGDEFN